MLTGQLVLNLLYALHNLRVKNKKRKNSVVVVVVVQANSKGTFQVRGLSFAIWDAVNYISVFTPKKSLVRERPFSLTFE